MLVRAFNSYWDS